MAPFGDVNATRVARSSKAHSPAAIDTDYTDFSLILIPSSISRIAANDCRVAVRDVPN
jgi:hypothetical protein